MKVALDTSVLVASSIADHPHERRARIWLEAIRSGELEGMVTLHALGETWATLTALPLRPKVAPSAAQRVVDHLRRHLVLRSLTQTDYRQAIQRCCDRGLRSGALYDGLHLVAAERWGADLLLTFNTRDFTRLVRESRPRIVAPPDPPGLL